MTIFMLFYHTLTSRWQRQHMLPLQFSAAPKLFPSFDDYCKILHYQQSMLLGGLHSDQIMFKNLTEFLVNLYSNLSINRGNWNKHGELQKLQNQRAFFHQFGVRQRGNRAKPQYPLLPLKQTKKVNGT